MKWWHRLLRLHGEPLSKQAAEDALRHCPRCGSGNVTGGSDGSVTCGFCDFVFKVYAQPTHPFMPQTVDGQPYVPEDGQGLSDQPLVPQGAPAPPPGAPVDPGAPSAPGGGLERFRVDQAQPAAPPALMTSEGKVLPRDSYIAHLAIRHADDRGTVIRQVRASRG
jgi:ribosomal protein S27AE